MESLLLREFHEALGGRFTELSGMEIVADYGDMPAEYVAVSQKAGVFDLSFRSRACLTGTDRVRFLHGQVTNDVKSLRKGEGSYAALVTAKGRMQSDLNIFALADELLLDFEPGMTKRVTERLEQYIVADDVQVIDVAPHYGLLSIQGPEAATVVNNLALFEGLPSKPLGFVSIEDRTLGELYLVAQPRLGGAGFDLFVPVTALRAVADRAVAAARLVGGSPCGWRALETCRIESGIPRFGLDMDESNLPQECGIEARAVSYSKGCYIGQEVLNRIHTLGHVNRQLCGLSLGDDLEPLPKKGDKLFHGEREVGVITSIVTSPRLKRNIALGYARREVCQTGTELTLRTESGPIVARVVGLPFQDG